MTVRFGNNRLVFYVIVFLLSGTVLGLAAHLANAFLPDTNRDFTIFALIIPSLTIFTFLLLLQWSQPRIEAGMLFVLGVLWLAMGAWTTDIIGNTQCDALRGRTVQTNSGTMSAQGWCREMKVMQAFSWMLFCTFVIAFAILQALVSRAQAFGRYDIWAEPIRELPWFGEAPGYYNTAVAGTPQYPVNMAPYAPGYGMPQVIPGTGQTVIIQPGVNGQAPTVTQIPSHA